MRFGGLGGKTMNKDNFEFVKEFSCACGKTHNTPRLAWDLGVIDELAFN